jgi:hypothetical protein
MPNPGLSAMAAAFEPEILVLSHADDDHIGGFSRFAATVHVAPRQIWVPYEWGLVWFALATAVGAWPAAESSDSSSGPQTGEDFTSTAIGPDALRALPGAGFDENDLRERADPSAGRGPHESVEPSSALPGVVEVSFDDALSDLSADDLGQCARREPIDAFGSLNVGPGLDAEVLGQIEELLGNATPRERQRIRERLADVVRAEQDKSERPRRPAPTGTPSTIAREIFDRAEEVCRILAWARSVGTTVRFFSTDAVRDDGTPPPWSWVGMPGVATVVNAREVRFEPVRIFDAVHSLFLAVSLTTTNRRALVTFFWPTTATSADGAILWSDSAGETCLPGYVTRHDLVPWEHIGIMTAPHHGSANPDHDQVWKAWERACARLARNIPVVVSGGKPKARLADPFLELSSELRACTNCRHPGHPGRYGRRGHRTVSAVFVNGSTFLQPKCE